MRKIYLLLNRNPYIKDCLDCLSLTDDGHVLGGHICSNMGYMMHDLHDRPDRLENIKNHFKDEQYEVEVLSYDECITNEGFKTALSLARKRDDEK